jgi:hypothetical protein
MSSRSRFRLLVYSSPCSVRFLHSHGIPQSSFLPYLGKRPNLVLLPITGEFRATHIQKSWPRSVTSRRRPRKDTVVAVAFPCRWAKLLPFLVGFSRSVHGHLTSQFLCERRLRMLQDLAYKDIFSWSADRTVEFSIYSLMLAVQWPVILHVFH